MLSKLNAIFLIIVFKDFNSSFDLYFLIIVFSFIAVYIFVGEHIALVDFIKCLQRRKLLDSGDYIVISVDDEIYDPNRKIKIMQRGMKILNK